MKIKSVFLPLALLVSLCIFGCAPKTETSDVGLSGETYGEDVETEDRQGESSADGLVIETAPSKSEEELLEEKVEELLDSMSLEEKVAQMFIVLPESLIDGVDCVTTAGDMTRDAINEIPVGGFIYLRRNLETRDQVRTMLENTQAFSYERTGLPMFLCVDEEGGSVARIGSSGNFGVTSFEDMAEVGKRNNTEEAFEIGATIGEYLYQLGFNVDFAPVADVLTNPENQVVQKRSFGSDAELVASMSSEVARGLASQNILGTYKHFPGHGDTAADTHEGYAYTNKTKEELYECELVPFRTGIDNDIPFIMVGHISLPNVIGDNTPASLSPVIIQDILREELGYEGIVITDSMGMGAISQQYSSSEAAIMTIRAGADIVLMPSDFKSAYGSVISAVNDGTLPMERIDESVARILREKIKISDESRPQFVEE